MHRTSANALRVGAVGLILISIFTTFFVTFQKLFDAVLATDDAFARPSASSFASDVAGAAGVDPPRPDFKKCGGQNPCNAPV